MNVPTFLRGGGEMGELIRGTRWEDTPLGPVESWSPALRTMVGVLLGNRFPMLLLWGPNLIQFYNDACALIFGDKHPRALGQSGSECWSEIWHIVGPMMEAPFRGEPATWHDDLTLGITRRGFLEECHFKCAYNPVPDDVAQPTGIGGVIVPVAETTERVYGERQLKTLRELAMRTANEKTAEKACRAAACTLSTATRDVPFALFYLVDQAGESARLVGAYGFDRAEQISPSEWPTVEHGLVLIEDLSRFGEHLPSSEWNTRPTRAVVIPLASPDQQQGYGFVVAGASPHRAFDEDYRGFFELAGTQVVTAIRNASAFETQRKRAEALAALDEAKTAFFSNVSHEFRTPLTLMLGPIEEGLQDLEQPLPPRQRERQEVVHRSSLRLLKLVNSLLDFSRIEAGRVQARFQPTDLGAYTADLASSFRSLVEKAGLTLTVDCPSLVESVLIDREMYEKIVLNLLSNAFKFTLEGDIRISVSADGERARLAVADTGTGIPDSELPHMFERFHRVEGANGRSYEGSGIGLALVQELVKLHGGSVAVSSRLAQGTVFTVSLPLGSSHLDPERIEAASTFASTQLGPAPFINEASQWMNPGRELASADVLAASIPVVAGAGRILLCDDNADMRQYVSQLLVEQGWDVESVEDGVAALRSVEARMPDLVLTDVMMPKLDGFGVLHALREQDDARLVPVILLSARAGEEARVEGLEAGADDYLVKPFAARELVARVRAHLSAARERREAARASDAARKTAQEEGRRKDEFLAMLSHELRNPMAAINMALAMMERAPGDLLATARHRATSQRQMANLGRLVDDLLDVSRITRGQIELKTRAMDFAALVEGALTSARATIDARGHRTSLTITSGDYRTDGDETRLEQAVVNLLVNAAKYTEPGGTISVTLTRDVAGGLPHAVLSVRDTGRGIPAEMLDKVFELFVQVSPTIDRSSGGLGLGLTLVKRLIEMHEGSVVARSEGIGKGSEFMLRLPLRTGRRATSEPKAAPPRAPAATRQRRRVLIVEDSDEFRDILREMLEDLGHEVFVANDGVTGVARILELRPDLALIDLGLPGIDGFEVARRVRAAGQGTDLYLVALTGYGGANDKMEAERAGYNRHLTKPISLGELVSVVGVAGARSGA